MNSAGILAALTVLAVAWTLRAMWLDMRRAERRVSRLRAENDRLRAALEDAEIDLQLWSEIHARAEAARRHPSNVRVLRSVDGGAS